MRQIIYISKATRRFDEDALRTLCERSKQWNASCGVTGLLLYDGARFIQALEGEDGAVGKTMSRIAADRRHTDIDFVCDRPIETREFGQWSMDYKRARSGCCSRDFLDQVKKDVSAVPDVDTQAAFIGFAVLGSQGPVGYRCSAG